MKKVINGLFAAVMLVAVGQTVCSSRLRGEGEDVPRARRGDKKLRGADLSSADLSGLDLKRAKLKGADLRDSDLSNVDLTGSDLSSAKMSGTNLEGAIGLSFFQKAYARGQGALNVPE